MLFYLLAGHALMDYSLQNDAMASCKCRKSTHPAQLAVPWYYWLTAHALLHGAAVAAVVRLHTGSDHLGLVFGIAETVVHWLIDLGKCERLYSIHTDQMLHVACKVLWWAAIAWGIVS
jgi:hypothetical protein